MPLQRDVIRAMLKLYGRDETFRFLMRYYGESEEGRYEFDRSPQRHRDLRDFVEDVLADVGGEL
ncbi:MAG: hypothetical protein ACUVRO_11095 [Armatimonadota bacterium]